MMKKHEQHDEAADKNKISYRRNLLVLFVLMLLVFVAVIGGLGYRTLIQGAELQDKAESIRTRTVEIDSARGAVYDRNGSTLAVSISADSIAVNPAAIKEARRHEVATVLSETLGLEYDSVMAKLEKASSFEWVKRKADFAAAEIIRQADLPGVQIIEESRRFYPKDMLAANLLGFAGVDNQGLEGIEFSYNDILSGTPGTIVSYYDSNGSRILESTQSYTAPEDGQNIYLTIDENIQYFAERELDAMMASENAPKACAILAMDPKTGEILAMASRPSYDPNNYGDYESSERRNMLVSDTYEPGSTFKIITASAGLDSGAVNTNSRFYDSGSIKIGSRTLRCWRHYNPHGSQSFAEIMQNSCNPAFVEIMLAMENKNDDIFYDYIEAFGFGQSTNLGLQGEAKGIVISRDKVSIQDKVSMSIGQSISVTPLQLVTAVSAVANGGTLLKPQLIKQITDADGNVIQNFEVQEVRRVISEKTAATVCSYLENVVAKGTGKSAYIEGYRVGGKSGTAQKAGVGGYQDGKYVASFIAVAPVDDPQIVMLAIVDEPSGALYQGGQVAAPMLKNVLEDALRYMGVTPQLSEMDKTTAQSSASKKVSVPDVTNLTLAEAEKVLKLAGLTAEVSAKEGVVLSQTPAAFSRVAQGTKVVLSSSKSAEEGGLLKVPDLTGYNIREAAELLSAMGLKMKTEGSGTAYEISPEPGSEIGREGVVTVRFNDETGDAVEPD